MEALYRAFEDDDCKSIKECIAALDCDAVRRELAVKNGELTVNQLRLCFFMGIQRPDEFVNIPSILEDEKHYLTGYFDFKDHDFETAHQVMSGAVFLCKAMAVPAEQNDIDADVCCYIGYDSVETVGRMTRDFGWIPDEVEHEWWYRPDYGC